jgi:hypothetical protein
MKLFATQKKKTHVFITITLLIGKLRYIYFCWVRSHWWSQISSRINSLIKTNWIKHNGNNQKTRWTSKVNIFKFK